MGDDLAIVNAARTSLDRQSVWVGDDVRRLAPADEGLINSLARNRHGTPFEMVQFKFHVHVPIGVAREWQRHRIGSFNEVSTRYVQMEPNFYVPPREAVRRQVGRAMAYSFEMMAEDEIDFVQHHMHVAYANAYSVYERLIALGVAKELARNVLPLGLFTQFVWSVNLRSLFNFLSLRTAPTALHEIRVEALAVEEFVKACVPYAHAAWYTGGRFPL